jgi:hypothetical protein
MLKSVRFSLHYGTRPNQNIVVVGEHHLFGEWDVQRGLRLGHLGGGQWMLEVVLPSEFNLEQLPYKYVLVDDSNGAQFWEAGPNRLVTVKHSVVPNGLLELRDTFQVRYDQVREHNGIFTFSDDQANLVRPLPPSGRSDGGHTTTHI